MFQCPYLKVLQKTLVTLKTLYIEKRLRMIKQAIDIENDKERQ